MHWPVKIKVTADFVQNKNGPNLVLVTAFDRVVWIESRYQGVHYLRYQKMTAGQREQQVLQRLADLYTQEGYFIKDLGALDNIYKRLNKERVSKLIAEYIESFRSEEPTIKPENKAEFKGYLKEKVDLLRFCKRLEYQFPKLRGYDWLTKEMIFLLKSSKNANLIREINWILKQIVLLP